MQYECIKLQMINDTSWVELSIVNGQLGTYYMVKEEEPNLYKMEDYKTGDYFDDVYSKYGNGINEIC